MTRFIRAIPSAQSLTNLHRAIDHAKERVPSGRGQTEIFMPLDIVVPDPNSRSRSFVLPEGTQVIFGDDSGSIATLVSNYLLGVDRSPVVTPIKVRYFRNSQVEIELES